MQPITVLKSGLWHLDIGKMPIPEPKKEVTLGIISEIYARFRKLSQKSYLFFFCSGCKTNRGENWGPTGIRMGKIMMASMLFSTLLPCIRTNIYGKHQITNILLNFKFAKICGRKPHSVNQAYDAQQALHK